MAWVIFYSAIRFSPHCSFSSLFSGPLPRVSLTAIWEILIHLAWHIHRSWTTVSSYNFTAAATPSYMFLSLSLHTTNTHAYMTTNIYDLPPWTLTAKLLLYVIAIEWFVSKCQNEAAENLILYNAVLISPNCALITRKSCSLFNLWILFVSNILCMGLF